MTLREVHGVRELAADYDGFVLDLWGVIHDGMRPYPGVLDCMAALLAAGKPDRTALKARAAALSVAI